MNQSATTCGRRRRRTARLIWPPCCAPDGHTVRTYALERRPVEAAPLSATPAPALRTYRR